MRLKLLVISLIVVIIFLLSPIRSAFAQNATPSASPTVATGSSYLNTNPDVPSNLRTYTQSVFIELASAISCMLTGFDPTNPEAKCLGVDPTTHKIGYVDDGGGAIAVVGSFISSTFYLPVNNGEYLQSVAADFGIVKQSYAQEGGLGFNSLLPTLKMWEAFRNITYMLFTLVFVVIGLGIMFRVKLDPRTVMTIQNQIPRIIMALLFVTFSYAIAGFMVDLMYVSIYLVIGVFAQQGYDTGTAVASNPFNAIGGIGGMSGIATGVSEAISGIVKDIFSGTIGTIVGTMVGALIGKLVGGSFLDKVPFGSTVSTVVGAIGGALFGNKIVGVMAWVITYLVIIIAIFSALLRLWFTLIKCYLYIFLTVVFAPFYIATGIIPGKSGIGSWIRGMLANLSVFPATVVMFLLGKAFIDGFSSGPVGTRPFTPPLVGDFVNPERMAAIIGLAVILLTPEVANMIRDALKATELKQGAAIGRGLSVGAGVVGAPIRGITKGFFGETRTGQMKSGTAFLTRTIGAIPTMILGGGHGEGHEGEEHYQFRLGPLRVGRIQPRGNRGPVAQAHQPVAQPTPPGNNPPAGNPPGAGGGGNPPAGGNAGGNPPAGGNPGAGGGGNPPPAPPHP